MDLERSIEEQHYKRFVLVSTTYGDELMSSAQKIVADSADRRTLELLRDERARLRNEWLAKHYLPRWAQYAVIATEEIQEVPSL